MPQHNSGANSGRRPQRPRQPPRKRQPARPRRPPQRGRPIAGITIPPPIRNAPPALSGVVGGIGILVAIALLFVACQALTGSSNDGGGNTTTSLPKVSIKGAKPCEFSDSKRINLNTQARLKACASAKEYAKARLVQKHGARKGASEFACLDKLWTNESRWSAWAINTGSGAYGIAQILPDSHGTPVKTGDWKGQVDWGLSYIFGRYKTVCNAWAFWQCTSQCPRYPGSPLYKTGARGDPKRTWY